MLAIDADTIDLDPLALVERLRREHERGIGDVERLLLSAPAPGGSSNDLLVWAAWHGEVLGTKLVTVFPGNEARGRGPNIRSVVLLSDGADGTPLAVVSGESFTRVKTAADSALGADLLARPDARSLAVLGAGSQAATHIRHLLAVRPSIARVAIWNRTAEKARALAVTLRRPGVEIIASDTAEAAVRGADIVSCLTAARTPVLHGRWLAPGCHVDLVGGFTPEMRESDDETVRRARLFVDTRRFTMGTCGDLARPIAGGVIAERDVLADLAELCAGAEGRRSPDEITLFKNGGGGHLDLMVARAYYEAATSQPPRTSS